MAECVSESIGLRNADYLPRPAYIILLILKDHEPKSITQLKDISGLTTKELAYGLRRLRAKELIDGYVNLLDTRAKFYSLKTYLRFDDEAIEMLESRTKKKFRKPRSESKEHLTPDFESQLPKKEIIKRPTVTYEDILVSTIKDEEVEMI